MKVIAITRYKKFDYLCANIIEGLYQNNVEIIASYPGNHLKKAYSDKKILKHSMDADYIFAFSGFYFAKKPPKYYLLDLINKPEITAYIDSAEYTYWGKPEGNQQEAMLKNPKLRRGKQWINEKMYNYCKWYFKRECYPEDAKSGIIPLLFAASNKNFGNFNCKKEIDVFCSFGQIRTGLRKEVQEICRKLKREGYNILINFGYPYNKYLKLISSSYITIDAWGAGDCNARLWEIFANKSCAFCQKYNILFPNKFTDGLNYVEYSTPKEFEEKLRYYLNDKEKCLEIAEKGYRHLLNYHTSKERVRYMLEKMREV